MAEIQFFKHCTRGLYKAFIFVIGNNCPTCLFSEVHENKLYRGLIHLIHYQCEIEVPLKKKKTMQPSLNDVEEDWERTVVQLEVVVTPRPDEVHSTCNCRGAYVH